MKKSLALSLVQMSCLIGMLSILLISCGTSQGALRGGKVKIKPSLPEDTIRANLLEYTPIGCALPEVLEFAQTRLKYTGPKPYEGGPATRQSLPQNPVTSIGVRSINVCIGEYGFPGRTGTFVSWAFDRNNRLVDIVIQKERDSL